MTEGKIKGRGWVKNAAIVFLLILLVLTFFSNDIRNRYLPEVATAYTTSGTVTTRIRGTGTVTAVEEYEVTMEQTREVQSVPVKTGDMVEPGDTLFVLAGTESEELKNAQKALEDLELQYQTELINSGGSSFARENADIQRARDDLKEAENTRDSNLVTDAQISSARSAKTQAETEVSSLEQEAAAIQIELSKARELGEPTEELEISLYEATSLLTDAQSRLANAELNLLQLEEKRGIWTTANDQVKTLQRTLEDLIIQLNEAMESEGRAKAIEQLNMQALNKQITEQKMLIAQLQEDSVGKTIESKVSGVVKSINVTPGNTAGGGAPMAIIEVVDRGYSLSFAVTNEQAQRVKIGDPAEVTSSMWGVEIKAVLESIKNSTEKPGTERILTFRITGQVESNTQLQLSVGQKSVEYQTIVPKSAIREDTNGSFVFIVTTKSTAMFNRYVATRVPVSILAQDDMNVAVEGGLGYSDNVIISSSMPLEDGMLVRMAGD